MERPKPRKTTSLAQILSPSKSGITITTPTTPPSLVSSKSTPNLTFDAVSEEHLHHSDSSPKPNKVSTIKSFFKRKNSHKQKHKWYVCMCNVNKICTLLDSSLLAPLYPIRNKGVSDILYFYKMLT